MAENSEKENTSPVNNVNIRDVIFMTLKRWPWIIVSVIVCVGAAAIYLMRTPPVYMRTATILIKDDAGGSSATPLGALSDMGLVSGNNNNIADEINKLQSPDIMSEVVKRLDLYMNYYVDGTYHRKLVYGSSLPIKVSLPSLMENETASLTVDVSDNGNITLNNLVRNGEHISFDDTKPIAFGDSVVTPLGTVVVAKTGYYRPGESYRIYVDKAALGSTVGYFAGSFTVNHKKDQGNAIILTASDVSTQRAEDLINGVISVYNEQWIENRNRISVSTSNFINERLSVIENELGNVDHDISSYQSRHLIPDVQQAASMYMSENQQTAARIMELNTQLQMTRYMRDYITNESNRTEVLPVNSGVGNANIENQISEYNDKLLQRNQYEANSSATHPVVMDLDAQLAGIRTAIISTIDNQIVALNNQIRSLQSRKNLTTEKIADNPTQAKYLLSVERQQKVKEALYLFLLQKREENELSQAFTAYNTQVITKPMGSNAPTAPQKSRILLAAFGLGLVLPFGVTYLLESTNTRVRGRKDLDSLTIPFLGEIPISTRKKREKTPEVNIVVKQGKRNVINEAFRVLRTNIGFMAGKDNGCSVIMITSFNPGSGKTFLTMNTAVSLAIKGAKVLVIDGDLRRGSTSKYVNSPKIGIADYLVSQNDDILSYIVKGSIIDHLDVIPVGTIPPNPTELLETGRFVNLVGNLSQHYDYILIDCPPVEMMADAQIIGQVVDRTVFVIRAGLLERSMLPELERLYIDKKFKNMSIVLNATHAEGSRYGYKYGYGYGYGYGNYNHYTSDK